MADTHTSTNPRDAFRAAVGAAKASLSRLDTESADETPIEDDDQDTDAQAADDEDPDAAADADETDDEPAPARVPVKAAKAGTVRETPATDDDETLISDEEFAKLQTTHKDDPAALRKALEKAFTQKTQRLSAKKKSAERLARYEPMIDEYEENPTEFARRLAVRAGLLQTEKDTKPAKTAAEKETELLTAIESDIKASLGTELEYLAEPLAPALVKAAKKIADALLEDRVKPLTDTTQELLASRGEELSERVMAEFARQHADWKDHEDEMFALSQRLHPTAEMTELEYLNVLYHIVTRESWEATKEEVIEREATGRFKKRVQKMNAAESGEPEHVATPDSQVRRRSPRNLSFQEAAKAAKAGIRFEDDDEDE